MTALQTARNGLSIAQKIPPVGPMVAREVTLALPDEPLSREERLAAVTAAMRAIDEGAWRPWEEAARALVRPAVALAAEPTAAKLTDPAWCGKTSPRR